MGGIANLLNLSLWLILRDYDISFSRARRAPLKQDLANCVATVMGYNLQRN